MNIAEHYRKLFLEKGDVAEASQWSSRASQEKRFEIITEIASLQNTKILDFGCGTGHLATYLKSQAIAVDYTGVDLVDELLTCGKAKHPEHHFCKLAEVLHEHFDYVLISGVFNNKLEDNQSFYKQAIKQCFALARRGLAFNMMSSYVDYYAPDLFYEKPEVIVEFIKQEVSPYLMLRHDYQVREGVVPFEFTVYVYKK